MKVTSKISLILGLGLCVVATSYAQVTPPPSSPPKPASPRISTPVVVEGRPLTPQVVTILHRLNGLKMFRLLLRSDDQVRAITKLDEAFKLKSEVHTNVIAGLVMEDGTIAAWLPEAEAELVHPLLPMAPPSPRIPAPAELPALAPPVATLAPSRSTPSFFERPDLTVIRSTGPRVTAQYVGLDGITGLSVLKINSRNLPQTPDASEEGIVIGQRLRLLGPEPAPRPETSAATRRVYVRMGEIDAKVTRINRSPSGGLANVRISSTRLTPASIGGIAINDAGETVGIVDAVEGIEASVLPSAVVRTAAKRVLERQASVPRPWLGVRGEPVSAMAVDQILGRGWKLAEAASLAEKQRGILLTSIAPGSPAAVAALQPGDVILRVNEGEVRTAEDFSWLLQEAGPGNSVRFTIMKPAKPMPESVDVKLSESFDFQFSLRLFDSLQKQAREPGSLLAYGIEAVALQPAVAARLGANGGLLVVSVRPASTAAKAGLRSGDVIQAINGQQLRAPGESRFRFSTRPGASHTFELVRDKQKLTLTYVTSDPASPSGNEQ
ncbi:MAG TPA: PDZ domain-containing protein [Pyrinomonadaceae bacterium]|nr:PDZ domain-containing protein [Pyrinomonadaceae bacterium]